MDHCSFMILDHPTYQHQCQSRRKNINCEKVWTTKNSGEETQEDKQMSITRGQLKGSHLTFATQWRKGPIPSHRMPSTPTTPNFARGEQAQDLPQAAPVTLQTTGQV